MSARAGAANGRGALFPRNFVTFGGQRAGAVPACRRVARVELGAVTHSRAQASTMTLRMLVTSPEVYVVGMTTLPGGGLRLDAGMFVERAA